MKKLIAIAIMCILCLTTLGWSTWYGTVYRDGVGQKYAIVWTNPHDAETETHSGGGYWLDGRKGMVEGRYYYWIKAQYGGYAGYNWVEDYFYQANPKTGLDIDLNIWVGYPDE